MSAFPPGPLQGTTGSPHGLPRPPRIPLLLVLLHGALGGVAIALAADEGFAAGKAAFASDAWRAVLGLIGAGLVFTAVRGLLRNLNQSVPTITEERRRSARLGGRLLILAGTAFVVWSVADDLAARSVSLDSWASPFFLSGGIYLLLLGLVLQLNPAGVLAQQRLAQGQGTPGVATLLRAADTGVTVGDAPQVRIELEIEVEGRRVPAAENVVMEQAKLALLIPGSTVDVLVDRENPNAFKIDWDSWRGPAS